MGRIWMFGRLVLTLIFLGEFKMASRRFLLTVIVSLFVFTSFTFAAAGDKEFPYIAEIIGTDVYVRSGPGLTYYFCSKLSTPARIIVKDEKRGWLKIVPPPASFSWISKNFVKVDAADKTIGIVTGDNVRVWAGSENMDPMHSVGLQGRLNGSDGAIVKLTGQEKGDYYRIVPPIGAHLWVHKKYTKYAGSVPKPEPVRLPPKPKATPRPQKSAVRKTTPVPAAKQDTPLVPPVKKVVPKADPVVRPKPKPAPKKIVLPAEAKRIIEYKQLAKLLDAELAKPLDTQNYDKIKKALKMIAADAKAGKAKQYAQYQLENISRYELAQQVTNLLAQQDKDLTKALDMIKAGRDDAVANIKDPGKFIVAGLLKRSQIYTAESGNSRYYVEDEKGKILCYAVPAADVEAVSGEFVGKTVGLKGTVISEPQNPIALVRFNEIAEQKE
jgi:hypothetical protein